MSKRTARVCSRHSREALSLLGYAIKIKRLERKMPAEDLAKRVGISRGMLHRIEKGDPTCGIGSVFEAAAVVGIPLFESDPSRLSQHVAAAQEKLVLLPKSAHRPQMEVRDNF